MRYERRETMTAFFPETGSGGRIGIYLVIVDTKIGRDRKIVFGAEKNARKVTEEVAINVGADLARSSWNGSWYGDEKNGAMYEPLSIREPHNAQLCEIVLDNKLLEELAKKRGVY